MKKNTFKLNGKTYKHDVYTRALEIPRYVVACNAPASISDEEIEKMLTTSVSIANIDPVGHFDIRADGQLYDNKGATGLYIKKYGKADHNFSYHMYSNWADFEAECK